MRKALLAVLLLAVGISCASLKGSHYFYNKSEVPISVEYLNDSTSIMYYASLPVTKIHFDVEEKYSSTWLTGIVKQVEVLDRSIYDYLGNKLKEDWSRDSIVRDQLICEGDKIWAHKHFIGFTNNHQVVLRFYSQSIQKKVLYGFTYKMNDYIKVEKRKPFVNWNNSLTLPKNVY